MPLVRVDIPEGASDAVKGRLRLAIRDAIEAALDPKITKYIYVSVREAFGEIGHGLPTVSVDLRPGREVERKAALAKGIAGTFEAALGVPESEIYLLFRESPAGDHWCGGEPLPEWTRE